MNRRSCLFLLFLALFLHFGKIYSHTTDHFAKKLPEDVSLFQENGKVGLKNKQGAVLIPAQYAAIGWSNGEFSLVNNTTGYQINGLWGLINLQNTRLTKAEYVDLSPGEGSLIVARKKISSALRIQTGCINTSGKEIIPFQYDGLRVSSFRAIVYTRNGSQFKHGLIDFENKMLIPLTYQNIYPLGSLRFGVENFESKTAIFSEDGKQITNFLIDSISSFKKDYAVIYQKQRQGLIDRQGQIKMEPTFREIKINDDGTITARQADAWLCLDGENKLIRQFNADSISSIDQNLFKIKTAGKIQLVDKEFKPVSNELFSFLGPFKKGKATFRYGNKMGIVDRKGQVVIKPLYQTLIMNNGFIRASQASGNTQRWVVLDSLGNAITSKRYEYIESFNGHYFPVKNRGYWGAMDISGKEIIACAHDSLIQNIHDHVVVKFKGNYGIINLREDWIVTPQSHRLQLIDDDRYLLLSPQTKFLKSFPSQVIYFSDNRLEIKDGYMLEHLPSGTTWKIDLNGVIIERSVQPDDVQKIFPESEGLSAIKKDGRYGFIDNQGRLRIANRYENVKPFSESLAPAMIRGKWGYINHEDKIAIQPVYDEVSAFRQNVALVKQKNLFGIVDRNGKLVLPPRYDSISVLTSKRFLVKQNGFWGLADGLGKMIVNPKFDQLTDLNNGYVIVAREGKFGLLTSQGISTIPQIYDGLTFDTYHNQYIVVKKASWETLQF
jgi:hypothetical protein